MSKAKALESLSLAKDMLNLAGDPETERTGQDPWVDYHLRVAQVEATLAVVDQLVQLRLTNEEG